MTTADTPAAIVRMAGWPIETLRSFGKRSADTWCAMGDEAFRIAYAGELQSERRALSAATREDTRFLRALAAANPDLVEPTRAWSPSAKRIKKVRHLETTLVRLLTRACTRTTPCGLWAGVSLAAPGSCDALRPAVQSIDVYPDLGAFVVLFEALCDAAATTVLERNPLVRVEEGTLVVARPDGAVTRLPLDGSWQAVVGRLPNAPTPRRALSRALQDAFGHCTTRAIDALVLQLRHLGILRFHRPFPTRYDSAWRAIALAREALPEECRAAWDRCTRVFRQACERLASPTADTIVEQVALCRDALRSALPDAVNLPRRVLRFDMAADVSLEFSAASWTALARATEAHAQMQTQWGFGRDLLALSRDAASRMLEAGPLDTAPRVFDDTPQRRTWDAMAHAAAHAPMRERAQRWSELLRSATPDVRTNGPNVGDAHPFSTSFVGVAMHEGCWVVRSAPGRAPFAFPFFGRFSRLLERTPSTRSAAIGLRRWFEAHFCALPGAYVVEDPSPALAGLRIRPALPLPLHGDLPLWVEPASPLAPNLQVQACLGHYPAADARFAAATVMHDVEFELPVTPSVTLNGATALRPRRWVYDVARLAAVLALKDKPARFRAWIRWARSEGWPPRCRLHTTARAPIVVPVGSPLAMEAFFEGLRCRPTGDHFCVETLETLCTIELGPDDHRVTELAVPRRERGWVAKERAS